MAITEQYVNLRFAQFAVKYEEALRGLGYTPEVIRGLTATLVARLTARDFKLYGDKPVNALHSGKRVTRFLLKSAIEYRPAARARRDSLYQEYLGRVQAVQRHQSHVTFLSFEAAYAAKLRVSLAPFRHLFRL